jgi:hypothetical protein
MARKLRMQYPGAIYHVMNRKGELEYTAIDMDTSGVINFSGKDRITRTATDVLHNAALGGGGTDKASVSPHYLHKIDSGALWRSAD